jgi:hypothetical protein
MLLACSAPAAAAPPLAGTWFGTGQPEDKGGMYIDHMLPNGEIHSNFLICNKGKPQDDTEDGNWSVSGDILTISVISHNGQFSPRVDTYRIVSVDGRQLSEIFLRFNFAYSPPGGREIPDAILRFRQLA